MFYRKLISWYFAIKQPILNTRHKCWNQIKSRGWAGGWVGVKNSKFLPLFWKYAYIIQISPPPSPWAPGSKAYAYVCIRYIYILFMYKYVLLSIFPDFFSGLETQQSLWLDPSASIALFLSLFQLRRTWLLRGSFPLIVMATMKNETLSFQGE